MHVHGSPTAAVFWIRVAVTNTTTLTGRWTSISFHVLGLAFVQAFTVLVFIFLAGIVTGVLS